MSYFIEWNPLLTDQEIKTTLAKLHMTFCILSLMSPSQVLKIVVSGADDVRLYASNGLMYFYRKSSEYEDRLEQIGSRRIGKSD